MRILVTGSRAWTREDLVRGAIQVELADHYVDPDWNDVVIVHGACPTGADLHAARWAFDFDVRQETYPANWQTHGKRAGPLRNQQMVNAGADVCLAFPLGASRGTRDCMRRAAEAGIPVKSFDPMPPGMSETIASIEDDLKRRIDNGELPLSPGCEIRYNARPIDTLKEP